VTASAIWPLAALAPRESPLAALAPRESPLAALAPRESPLAARLAGGRRSFTAATRRRPFAAGPG
jgi:hypothetical protein